MLTLLFRNGGFIVNGKRYTKVIAFGKFTIELIPAVMNGHSVDLICKNDYLVVIESIYSNNKAKFVLNSKSQASIMEEDQRYNINFRIFNADSPSDMEVLITIYEEDEHSGEDTVG